MGERYSAILGTGRYIPPIARNNDSFRGNEFYSKGKKLDTDEVIGKFPQVSGINERRYAEPGQQLNDLAFFAAKSALETANVSKESLDEIIVAHDANAGSERSMQAIAASVTSRLGIKEGNLSVYDLTSGCSGWVKAIINADHAIKSGADKVLVIGAELTSRMFDVYDRNSLLFGDGAGAVVLSSSNKPGLITGSYAKEFVEGEKVFYMDISEKPGHAPGQLYPKIDAHQVFKLAISKVPGIVQESIKRAGLGFVDISNIFAHQANARITQGIMKKLAELNDLDLESIDPGMMPMTVSFLGNTSTASVPITLDYSLKGELGGKKLVKGNNIVLVSFGAGMNVDSVVYSVYN